MKDRFKAIPAVYLFLRQGDQILLTRRCNTGYQDGNYMVPSGHVEQAESLTQAIAREAKEEIGIEINPNDLKFVHLMYRAKHDETGERIDVFFQLEKFSGNIENKEPEKCDDIYWFSVNDLPGNIPSYLKQAIINSEKHNYFSEEGWD